MTAGPFTYFTPAKKAELAGKIVGARERRSATALVDEIAAAIAAHETARTCQALADLAAGATLPETVTKVNNLLAELRLAQLMVTPPPG